MDGDGVREDAWESTPFLRWSVQRRWLASIPTGLFAIIHGGLHGGLALLEEYIARHDASLELPLLNAFTWRAVAVNLSIIATALALLRYPGHIRQLGLLGFSLNIGEILFAAAVQGSWPTLLYLGNLLIGVSIGMLYAVGVKLLLHWIPESQWLAAGSAMLAFFFGSGFGHFFFPTVLQHVNVVHCLYITGASLMVIGVLLADDFVLPAASAAGGASAAAGRAGGGGGEAFDALSPHVGSRQLVQSKLDVEGGGELDKPLPYGDGAEYDSLPGSGGGGAYFPPTTAASSPGGGVVVAPQNYPAFVQRHPSPSPHAGEGAPLGHHPPAYALAYTDAAPPPPPPINSAYAYGSYSTSYMRPQAAGAHGVYWGGRGTGGYGGFSEGFGEAAGGGGGGGGRRGGFDGGRARGPGGVEAPVFRQERARGPHAAVPYSHAERHDLPYPG